MRAHDCRGPGTVSRQQGIPVLGRGQTLGIGVEAAEATSSSRSTNWTRVLRGPRYVDAPFRVLLLLIAVVGLTPASLEAPDPLYWAFQVLAAILLVALCFTPVIAVSVGLILFVVFVLTYPDFVNPFQTVGEAVVAFLLSQRRLRLFFLFSALLFGVGILPTSLGLWGGEREPLTTLSFGWLLAVILGLVAAGFERRIQAEISRREGLSRTHERKLERMQLEMALDTHDTVSHGLAAGSAIVMMLGVDARLEGRSDGKLTELVLVNAHTQQQLRVLLSRLTDDPDGRSSSGDFENEILRAAEMIRSATEAGGFEIDVRDSRHDQPAQRSALR